MTETQRFFETVPLTRLFFRLALPNAVSAIAASLYFVADGMFIGHYRTVAELAAYNLIMPVVMVSFMLADMIAMGSSVRIGIALGRREEETASRVFTFALGMLFLSSVIAGGFALLFSGLIPRAMGAESALAVPAAECLRVYALFAPLVMPFWALDNYLRVCGHPKLSMAMNLSCAMLNVALDFIFLGPMGLGVWSAALASCLAFGAGALAGLSVFLSGKLTLRVVGNPLPVSYAGKILKSGSSEFFSNISDSLFQLVMNVLLLRFMGTEAVAAFSLVMYVDAMVMVLLRSLSDALQPAISYCYGAGLSTRVFNLEKRVLAAGAFLTVSMFLLLRISGESWAVLFVGEEETLTAAAAHAMGYFSFAYLFNWCGVGLSDFFTAIARPALSLVQTVSQAFLLPAVFLAIFFPLLGADGLWLAPAAGRGAAAVLAVGLLKFGLRAV